MRPNLFMRVGDAVGRFCLPPGRAIMCFRGLSLFHFFQVCDHGSQESARLTSGYASVIKSQ